MTVAPYKSALQLNEKEKERCSYPLRLDVYGNGCEHDCTYCYARDSVRMGGWNNSRNLEHPYPRVVNFECLRRIFNHSGKKPDCVKIGKGQNWNQIRRLLDERLPLRVGALTDCFQERMELRTHAGLKLLKAITEANYPAQIVTKSNLIAENEYIDAMSANQKNLVIQLSITTLSDNVSRAIEPFAPSTSKRFDALTRLIKEGFYTSVRINPLFPIFPDETLTRLTPSSDISKMAHFQKAMELKIKTLPIFGFDLVEKVIDVFSQSPKQTAGKHTLIAGFVRLSRSNLNLVSKAIHWQPDELIQFFPFKKGRTYYYTSNEIRYYYEAIRELCYASKVPFSVCYDADDNYEVFRRMWANPQDCCNALGNVSGFKKVYRDCCLPKTS